MFTTDDYLLIEKNAVLSLVRLFLGREPIDGDYDKTSIDANSYELKVDGYSLGIISRTFTSDNKFTITVTQPIIAT